MLYCLLEVNSSTRVIENAISCVIFAKEPHIYWYTLKANPEAANCLHQILLHDICVHIKGDLCLKALSLFITIKKEAIREPLEDDELPYLPVHAAASHNTVEVLNFFLNECPESATDLCIDLNNWLHLALSDSENEIDTVEAKVIFLTTNIYVCVL